MKLTREKMLYVVIVISLAILVFILFGCPQPQTPAPAMPKLTTEQSKSCARSCQSMYAQCNTGCSQMVGGVATAAQRRQCLDNCNQILKECYSTCE